VKTAVVDPDVLVEAVAVDEAGPVAVSVADDQVVAVERLDRKPTSEFESR
jgi:hypothetical protein